MNNLLAILFVAIMAQTIHGFASLPRPNPYIVNGTDVKIEDIPFQVSVRRFGSHTCGGSIISGTIILTAAHCLEPYTPDFIVSFYSIRVGNTSRDDGREYFLANAVYHSGFSTQIFNYDVGLLKLNTTLEFGPTVQPVVLVEPNFKIPYGEIAVVSGWGRLWHGGPLAETLQAADIEFLNTVRCTENYAAQGFIITYDMFCAGSFYGKVDNCHGDSGGPVIYNNRQVGIVSWGLACAQHDFPGVYASVTELRAWIDEEQAKL